jgi:cobalt-zinc-cadmium efflux system protein
VFIRPTPYNRSRMRRLTAHLVMPKGHPGDTFLIETCRNLAQRFNIGHATLQVETSEDVVCALAPEHVV